MDNIERTYNHHRLLVEAIHNAKAGFVYMGKLLMELKRNENFKNAVGQGIDTWDDYLKQPEIDLSRGEANRLVDIYHFFIVQLGYSEEEISQIPQKNLHYLLPVVKKGERSKEEIGDMIDDAKVLAQKDFRNKIKGHECTEYEDVPMQRCIECNKLSKKYDI